MPSPGALVRPIYPAGVVAGVAAALSSGLAVKRYLPVLP
jgi:hypothetical protein